MLLGKLHLKNEVKSWFPTKIIIIVVISSKFIKELSVRSEISLKNIGWEKKKFDSESKIKGNENLKKNGISSSYRAFV